MKKTILSFALIVTTIATAYCQLNFKNTTAQPIYIAVAYQNRNGDFDGYYSIGWYKVVPNETIEILPGVLVSRNYYYYAYAEDMSSVWEGGGDYPFLVNPNDAFKIKNANQQYVQNEKPFYVWKNFRMLDVGRNIRYTQEL